MANRIILLSLVFILPVLGVGHSAEKSKKERLAELAKLGASFEKNEKGEVVGVDFYAYSPGVTDEELKMLQDQVTIVYLDLHATNVSEVGLSHLKKLVNLKTLILHNMNISDRGIDSLKELKLETLWLFGTKITASGAKTLGKMDSLRKLHLGLTFIGDMGAGYLNNLKKLTHLDVQSVGLTGKGLAELNSLKELEYLDLSLNHLGDIPDSALSAFPKLRVLRLHNTGISDKALKKLSRLEHLVNLDLSSNEISVKEILPKTVQFLSLSYTKVSDSGLDQIGSLPELKTLKLDGCRVSDKGIQLLQNANLEEVSLGDTAVTTEGVEKLKKTSKKDLRIKY